MPYLMLLPINLMNRIPILLIHHIPNRYLILHRTHLLQTTFVSASSLNRKAHSKKNLHNAPHTS